MKKDEVVGMIVRVNGKLLPLFFGDIDTTEIGRLIRYFDNVPMSGKNRNRLLPDDREVAGW